MIDDLDTQPEILEAHVRRRYQIRVGEDTAGFTQFVDIRNQRIFFHTEIDERFSGQGLATTLIRTALADTVGRDLRIVPICEFVAGFLTKHDDFAAHVDPVTPEAERLVDESSEPDVSAESAG